MNEETLIINYLPRQKLREAFCAWLFKISERPYANIFKRKRKAWGLSSTDLLTYPPGSLGFELGMFLQTNGFELLDKLETHDAYHVITGISVTVKDEIGMQFMLLGNGKRTLYLYGTILLGLIMLPEYSAHFFQCYKTGKNYQSLDDLDIKYELNNSLKFIRHNLKKRRKPKVRMYDHLNDIL